MKYISTFVSALGGLIKEKSPSSLTFPIKGEEEKKEKVITVFNRLEVDRIRTSDLTSDCYAGFGI
uniref:Uncharacterized protein n=1 Tax=candidate division WOR-3 bacterium TaxID=2052148 RepID=A0A7C6EAF0_UNCW3